MAGTSLSEVIAELGHSEESSGPGRVVSRAKLARWLEADDIDVLGAVYALVADPSKAKRINPPLAVEEVSAFLQRYFSRCLREDPKSEWADSSYTAGWDIVRWFAAWWAETPVPRE